MIQKTSDLLRSTILQWPQGTRPFVTEWTNKMMSDQPHTQKTPLLHFMNPIIWRRGVLIRSQCWVVRKSSYSHGNTYATISLMCHGGDEMCKIFPNCYFDSFTDRIPTNSGPWRLKKPEFLHTVRGKVLPVLNLALGRKNIMGCGGTAQDIL